MSVAEVSKLELEKIASKIAQGHNVQKIAIDADLDFGHVEDILASKEFAETFKSIDPAGYAKWAENQADLRAKKQVMSMAREDSVEFYKEAKRIALTSKDLKDKEKLDALLQLLKIAKIGEGESPREVIELSNSDLETILKAWDETTLDD